MCEQAAEQYGCTISDHHIFTDDGYSGALLERPGLDRLMALARSRQIMAVFVADGDRLSREPAHDWLIRQELRQCGVTLYVNGKPVDETPEGEMKDSLLAIFAKYERLKSKQRMLDGKKRRAGWLKDPGSGKPMGCQMPLGYIYLPDPEGRIIVDEDEAGVVRRIYRMCLDGYGIWSIARTLTDERIPTKMDRQPRANSKLRGVGVWNIGTVAKILHNETYATGVIYWNRRQSVEPREDRRRKAKNLKDPKSSSVERDRSEWLEIHIEPIITRETFDQAQEVIKRNAQKNPRRRLNEYLFLNGHLRCGWCGYALSGYTSNGCRYYRCTGGNNRPDRPCRTRVNADAIESETWVTLYEGILQDEEPFLARLHEWARRADGFREHVQQQITSAQAKIVDGELVAK